MPAPTFQCPRHARVLVLVALVLCSSGAVSAREQAAYVLLAPGVDVELWARSGKQQELRVRPVLRGTQAEALRARFRETAEGAAKGELLLERISRWLRVEGEAAQLAALALEGPRVGVQAYEPAPVLRIAALPNDPEVVNQPYLPLIRASEAYELARGGDAGIIVGIVDGGTDWRHEDLRANIFESPTEIEGNGIDDDGNGYVDDVRGWNFPADNNDPTGLPQTPNNARHGTHVAGIVAAVSDNGLGIAGVSWNARILPVNVSTADGASDGALPYGFEGALYAAASGAQIINASWGRSSGRWSDFENDLMQLFENAGILFVAAAGNQLEKRPFYPAFYPTALSVTRVGLDRRHYFSANHDGWIDLAAPGTRILSTWPDNRYGLMDGTSQATAVTSGVAALLMAGAPELVTPAQLRERLRWTTSEIYDVNEGLERELGTGMVDAEAALTQNPPGIEIANLRLLRAEDGALPGRGELLGLYFDLRNRLAPSGAFTLHLYGEHPNLTPLRTTLNVGGIQSDQLLSVRPGLLLWADDNAPASQTGQITIEIAAKSRKVHQGFTVEAVPGQVVVRAADLHFTHTNNGRLGYLQPLRFRDPGGEGIGPGEPKTLVQFGSLLVGLGPTQVADAMIAPADASLYRDFRPPFDGGLQQELAGASSHYTDALALPRVGVRVEQRTLRSVDPDALLSVYELSPVSGRWEGARAGLLVDFEMWRFGDAEADQLQWLPRERLLAGHSESWSSPYLGVALLEGPGAAAWSWLRDLRGDDSDGRAYIFDAGDLEFRTTDAQLWELLSSDDGTQPSEIGSIAGVIHCGPFDVEESAGARLTFAWVIGGSLDELRAGVERARYAWSYLRAGQEPPRTARLQLLPNAPNPFNPRTTIRFSLDHDQPVRISIYDQRGRLVRNLLNQRLLSGYHELSWDGLDGQGDPLASGVYQVLLDGRSESARQSVVLLR